VDHRRNTRLMVVALVVVAAVVALLPALIAYRYTSPEQRDTFVCRPWRGWSFVVAALRVPGDSELKTSGQALRKADWLFEDTLIEPQEVQLLFVTADEPYAFTQDVGGRLVTAQVTPSYRFIWEVRGTVPSSAGGASGSRSLVVALLDYETGRLLYDVRQDLPEDVFEEPAPSAPSAAPGSSAPASGAPLPASTP